jgi:hypothetical protein
MSGMMSAPPAPQAQGMPASPAPAAPPMAGGMSGSAPGGPPQMPPMPNMSGGELDMWSAPIPGQSLTREPGSYPFERPPQFTDPEDAFTALLKALTQERAAIQLMNMLEIGVPVKAIVQTILQGGFMEGKWSVDVALLLSQPLTALILRMAREANIRPNLGIQPKQDVTLEKVVEKRLKSLNSSPGPSGLIDRPRKR